MFINPIYCKIKDTTSSPPSARVVSSGGHQASSNNNIKSEPLDDDWGGGWRSTGMMFTQSQHNGSVLLLPVSNSVSQQAIVVWIHWQTGITCVPGVCRRQYNMWRIPVVLAFQWRWWWWLGFLYPVLIRDRMYRSQFCGEYWRQQQQHIPRVGGVKWRRWWWGEGNVKSISRPCLKSQFLVQCL